jgi:hypothetical protein
MAAAVDGTRAIWHTATGTLMGPSAMQSVTTSAVHMCEAKGVHGCGGWMMVRTRDAREPPLQSWEGQAGHSSERIVSPLLALLHWDSNPVVFLVVSVQLDSPDHVAQTAPPLCAVRGYNQLRVVTTHSGACGRSCVSTEQHGSCCWAKCPDPLPVQATQ